jgi:uncharacterized membrane protein
MRSKLNIAGHPLHPMLIPLPVASAIFALASDIVGRATGSETWLFMGYVLTISTWVTGLLAAVPGLADFLYVVPKNSQALVHATVHLILNLVIVGIYFVSWIMKNAQAPLGSTSTPLILEIVGVVLLTASGWFGWTLVYKHRVGVVEEPVEESKIRKAA